MKPSKYLPKHGMELVPWPQLCLRGLHQAWSVYLLGLVQWPDPCSQSSTALCSEFSLGSLLANHCHCLERLGSMGVGGGSSRFVVLLLPQHSICPQGPQKLSLTPHLNGTLSFMPLKIFHSNNSSHLCWSPPCHPHPPGLTEAGEEAPC